MSVDMTKHADLNAIKEVAEWTAEKIAPEFSNSENYAVGNMVVHGGILYRFIAEHPASAWIGTDVEQADLGREAFRSNALLRGTNAALAKIGGFRVVEWETGCNIPSPSVGQQMDYTRVRSTYWARCCAVVPINPGEVLSWSGRAGAASVGLAYVFVDEDDLVISRSISNLQEPTSAVAPDGAVAVVLNNHVRYEGASVAPYAVIGDSALDISHAVASNLRTVETLHSLVKYHPDYNEELKITPGSTSTASLGIARIGNVLTLNKTVAASSAIRVRVSGKLERAGNNSAVSAWTDGLEVGKDLVAGHKYRARITYLSGSSKLAEEDEDTRYPPSINVYETGESTPIGTQTRGSVYVYRDWTAETGKSYIVALLLSAGNYFFDDAQFAVTVEDLTGNIDLVAPSNIQSGQYFTIGNNLYLATAAIASGTEVIPGTNCIETNLADALTPPPLFVEQYDVNGGRMLDKTWQEIHDKFVAGVPVYITTPPEWGGGDWELVVLVADNVHNFSVFSGSGWEWRSDDVNEPPHHFF